MGSFSLNGFNFSTRRNILVLITVLIIFVTPSCPAESANCTKFDLKEKCPEGTTKNVGTEPIKEEPKESETKPPLTKSDLYNYSEEGGGGIRVRRMTAKKRKLQPASRTASAPTAKKGSGKSEEDDETSIGVISRIIGGKKANSGEFPYQIAFFELGRVKCGGSILDENWVLTAAHCMVANLAKNWDVIAGEFDTAKDEGIEQWRQIEKIVVHEKYDHAKSLHDIALVKLDAPLEFGKFVKPVVLPKRGFEFKKGKVSVTGWGSEMSGSQDQPTILQKVSVSLIYYKACAKAYEISEKKFTITENMICAGQLGEGGKDACQGDSGGPLAFVSKKGDFLQVGIVSFGEGCGDAKFPGVYVQVSKYIDWITKHTNIKLPLLGPHAMATMSSQK